MPPIDTEPSVADHSSRRRIVRLGGGLVCLVATPVLGYLLVLGLQQGGFGRAGPVVVTVGSIWLLGLLGLCWPASRGGESTRADETQ